MATRYWNHNNTKNNLSFIDPAEWNSLASQASGQTVGALFSIGPGVVPLPDDTAFEVIEDGATVAIRAGAGIAFHSTEGPAFFMTETQSNLEPDFEIIANTTDNYIFARFEIGPTINDPDSRETLLPLFECHDTDTLDGAILLAQVDTTQTPFVITDLRPDNWIPIEFLKQSVADLKTELEELTERVNAITDPDPGNGNTGEITRAEWNALLLELSTLKAEVAKLQREAVGDPLKETRDEGEIDTLRNDWHHHLANDSYQSSTLPQRVDAAVIIPGRTGAGEKNPDGTTQPIHYTGGNWPRNPRRRRFSNL